MPRYMVQVYFCLGGQYGDVLPGTVVEVDEHVARMYVQQGRLVGYEGEAEREGPSSAPAVPSKGPEAMVTRDPSPRRRGGRKESKR